jgi:hypothetical protein
LGNSPADQRKLDQVIQNTLKVTEREPKVNEIAPREELLLASTERVSQNTWLVAGFTVM